MYKATLSSSRNRVVRSISILTMASRKINKHRVRYLLAVMVKCVRIAVVMQTYRHRNLQISK